MVELPKLSFNLPEGGVNLGIIGQLTGEIEDIGPVAGELAYLCPNALVLIRNSQAHPVFLQELRNSVRNRPAIGDAQDQGGFPIEIYVVHRLPRGLEGRAVSGR